MDKTYNVNIFVGNLYNNIGDYTEFKFHTNEAIDNGMVWPLITDIPFDNHLSSKLGITLKEELSSAFDERHVLIAKQTFTDKEFQIRISEKECYIGTYIDVNELSSIDDDYETGIDIYVPTISFKHALDVMKELPKFLGATYKVKMHYVYCPDEILWDNIEKHNVSMEKTIEYAKIEKETLSLEKPSYRAILDFNKKNNIEFEFCIENGYDEAEFNKLTSNVSEFNLVDGFTCAKCGMTIKDYVRIEKDEDYDEEFTYEFTPTYCPRCGRRIVF